MRKKKDVLPADQLKIKESCPVRRRAPARIATLVTSRPHGTIDHQKNLRNFGPKDARYQMFLLMYLVIMFILD